MREKINSAHDKHQKALKGNEIRNKTKQLFALFQGNQRNSCKCANRSKSNVNLILQI